MHYAVLRSTMQRLLGWKWGCGYLVISGAERRMVSQRKETYTRQPIPARSTSNPCTFSSKAECVCVARPRVTYFIKTSAAQRCVCVCVCCEENKRAAAVCVCVCMCVCVVSKRAAAPGAPGAGRTSVVRVQRAKKIVQMLLLSGHRLQRAEHKPVVPLLQRGVLGRQGRGLQGRFQRNQRRVGADGSVHGALALR
jgi:hypothetical protein